MVFYVDIPSKIIFNIKKRIMNIPFDFPAFLFETLVYRLGYRRLHQVNVSDDEWSKRVSKMLMKTPIF